MPVAPANPAAPYIGGKRILSKKIIERTVGTRSYGLALECRFVRIADFSTARGNFDRVQPMMPMIRSSI
jgi:hypothetical protein